MNETIQPGLRDSASLMEAARKAAMAAGSAEKPPTPQQVQARKLEAALTASEEAAKAEALQAAIMEGAPVKGDTMTQAEGARMMEEIKRETPEA